MRYTNRARIIMQTGMILEHLTPLPEPSDEALAARVAQRDVAAFSQLFDRYAQLIYVFAGQMLGTADADEIVQEVFLRFWKSASQFDGGRGSFRAWFMAIARHQILNELRRRSQEQRRQAADQIDRLLEEAADPSVDVEEAAWLRERQDVVLRALGELPDEQRRALVLAYFGGLSHSAIAQQLGWPLGTVKKRIQLGMQKLRAALAQHRPDAEAPVGSKPPPQEYE
jgi:RNA polymerase sigma-70 factor (ECF subfamily)